MKIYGINTSDVIMICCKNTLEADDFFEGMKNDGAVYPFFGKNYNSGVLCCDGGKAVLKLLKKNSSKLSMQIKEGAIYLK